MKKQSRFLQDRVFNVADYALPINKGGTNSTTSSGARANLGLLATGLRNVPNGIAGLDTGALTPFSIIPENMWHQVDNVAGLTSLVTGSQGTYLITDYDSSRAYILEATLGTVSRVGDTITYTAPETAGAAGFTINGKACDITVFNPYIAAPSIEAPVNGAIDVDVAITITASAFAAIGGSDTHEASDWQLATDSGFTSIVQQSVADTVNKTTWSITGLIVGTVYYARVRYKGTSLGYSDWSAISNFTTKADCVPSLEEAILLASDVSPGANYGISVDIDETGTRIVVGAEDNESDIQTGSGQAYVYVRSGSTWAEEAILQASDRHGDANFGNSCSISSDGTRIAIGAPASAVEDFGAVYIFVRVGSIWTQEAKLEASDKATGDWFGGSVHFDSTATRIIIGAEDDDHALAGMGSAYIFSRSGTTWTEEAKLIAIDGDASDFFGIDVAMDATGSRVVIGSLRSDNGGGSNINYGAAYVFVRSGTTWSQEAKLIASDMATVDEFGKVVAINGDGSKIAAGAAKADPATLLSAGKVYIFDRTGTAWSESTILTASNKAAGDNFGSDVSFNLTGDLLLIGASGVNYLDSLNTGAAYLFEYVNSTWNEHSILLQSDIATAYSNALYGESLSLSKDGCRCIIGAYRRENFTGGCYVYR